MAVKTKTGWKCSYCGKPFSNRPKADMCRDSHDLVYIPMARSDVARLLQFIMTKEDRILSEPIILTLRQIVQKENIKLGRIPLNPIEGGTAPTREDIESKIMG